MNAQSPSGSKSLARNATLLGVGILVSRILGLGREAVVTATFDVSAIDCFVIAFTIPNALRMLLAEGAVSAAFVPVFTQVRHDQGDEAAHAFFARLLGAMGLILLAVTVLGMWGTPWLVSLYAGGFDAERMQTTVDLTRLMFPYILLMGLAALAAGILNAMRRFTIPAFSPALLNIALIAAALSLPILFMDAGWGGIFALGVGALVGGALQLGTHGWALRRAGVPLRPRWGLGDPAVKRCFKLMVPLLAGLGVYQVNTMLGRRFASFLGEGPATYLYLTQRVVEIPQGMFAIAIATASLPALSELRAKGDSHAVREAFGESLRLTLFVAIPASVALLMLADPVIRVLFTRGEFTPARATETAQNLMVQATGIWAVAAVRTIIPMFHAYNETRIPVVGSLVNLIVYAGTAYFAMHAYGHLGLAFALVFAAMLQLVTLLWLLRRRVGRLGLGSVAKAMGQQAISAVPMALILGLAVRLGPFGGERASVALALALGVAIVLGGAAYLLTARALGSPEAQTLVSGVARRIRRKR